jgi:hypothetical protein
VFCAWASTITEALAGAGAGPEMLAAAVGAYEAWERAPVLKKSTAAKRAQRLLRKREACAASNETNDMVRHRNEVAGVTAFDGEPRFQPSCRRRLSGAIKWRHITSVCVAVCDGRTGVNVIDIEQFSQIVNSLTPEDSFRVSDRHGDEYGDRHDPPRSTATRLQDSCSIGS